MVLGRWQRGARVYRSDRRSSPSSSLSPRVGVVISQHQSALSTVDPSEKDRARGEEIFSIPSNKSRNTVIENVEKPVPTVVRAVPAGARPVHGTISGNARKIAQVARTVLVGNRLAVSLGNAVRRRQLLLVQL